MPTKSFQAILKDELPVLFLLIGWTRQYMGTELVVGAHQWLQANPQDNWEAKAFLVDADTGRYACGIGHGAVQCERLHVIFVARDPTDGQRKVVGAYGAADVDTTQGYPRASTKYALLLPPHSRPVLKHWPGDTGVRRWADRAGGPGIEHKALLRWFERFRGTLNVKRPEALGHAVEDQTYFD